MFDSGAFLVAGGIRSLGDALGHPLLAIAVLAIVVDLALAPLRAVAQRSDTTSVLKAVAAALLPFALFPPDQRPSTWLLTKRLLAMLRGPLLGTLCTFVALAVALVVWRALGDLVRASITGEEAHWPLIYADALARGHWDQPVLWAAWLVVVGGQAALFGAAGPQWPWLVRRKARHVLALVGIGVLAALLPYGLIAYVGCSRLAAIVRRLITARRAPDRPVGAAPADPPVAA